MPNNLRGTEKSADFKIWRSTSGPKIRQFFLSIGHRIQKFAKQFVVGLKLWYSYNKQTIPLIFILIAGFIFTAFLDFTITLQEGQAPFVFESHIRAIVGFVSSSMGNLSGFFLFSIYMIAIIQMFNGFTFAKKQAPGSLFLITGLTVIQIVLVGLYTSCFFLEAAARADFIIDEVDIRSYSIMITGASVLTVGTVFAWFYVNWHYVKEIED